MRVVALRRTPTAPPVGDVEVVASLGELMAQSDHVIVAAPATPQTHHLINASALAAAKPGGHLINVARGTLVDQDAVLAALDRGELAMASLDVVDPEPLPPGHPLYTHPRVRLSPHVSWSSPDTGPRTIEMFVDNHRRYRAGEPLHGVVDTSVGY
jgi:phosphoglycerate dehydrogenase-like enzyme